MKRLTLGSLIVGLFVPLFAVPALADPTVTVAVVPATAVPGALRAQAHATYTVPTTTIFGRPDKPMVTIVVRRPTAASAAGEAHDRLRVATVAKSEPGIAKSDR
jgi:hypothetical protein